MAGATTELREAPAGLVVRLANGTELPLVIGPSQVRALTGDRRSEHAVRGDCSSGIIPTLPRAGGSGAHHRVPTARLLDELGIPYEVAEASPRVRRDTGTDAHTSDQTGSP